MQNGKAVDEKLILVVDDELYVREALSDLLTAEGYSVLQAANGQEALDLLGHGPRLPRVILMDLLMPVMGGGEFLKRRAADWLLRLIPVIVISGHNRLPEFLNGIDVYMRKPVDPTRLLAIIRAARVKS